MADNVLTKSELIDLVATRTSSSKAEIQNIVGETFNAITAALSDEIKVNLAGFGSLEVVTRKEREGRNPRTGETIHIPKTKTVKFKVAKQLKEAVQ